MSTQLNLAKPLLTCQFCIRKLAVCFVADMLHNLAHDLITIEIE